VSSSTLGLFIWSSFAALRLFKKLVGSRDILCLVKFCASLTLSYCSSMSKTWRMGWFLEISLATKNFKFQTYWPRTDAVFCSVLMAKPVFMIQIQAYFYQLYYQLYWIVCPLSTSLIKFCPRSAAAPSGITLES
jgi:hypothetical protein